MKRFKRFLMIMGLGLCFGTNALGQYQLPNGNFEGEWTSNTRQQYSEETPANWNSFYTAEATGAGTGIAFSIKNQVGKLNKATDSHSGNYAAKIVSQKNMLQSCSNGNLTTGIINMGSSTAADKSNYNYTKTEDTKGSQTFSGLPDAVSVWFKFVPVTNTNKGQVNMILHKEMNYKDPNESDANKSAYQVSNALSLIDATSEWQEYKIPFIYNANNISNSDKRYILISFTTNQNPGIGATGDALWIDDIQFVYNSQLSALTYDGKAVAGFATDNYNVLDMSTVNYDASKLACTSNGVGASIQSVYNDETGLLTITVNGNDISVNSGNKHVYKVQFKIYTANLASLTVNGASVLKADQYYYTVLGEHTDSSIQWVAEDGSDAIVTENYDANTRISTIHVSAGNKENTYFVKFAKATTDYTGKMFIEMDMGSNSLLSASSEVVGISAPIGKKVDFQLLNFKLEGIGNVGDIFVTDVPYIPTTDGSITLYREQTIVIFGALGTGLGNLPVVLNGIIKDGKLAATIDIKWYPDPEDQQSFFPIQVNVYPFSTASIDLSDVVGTGDAMAMIKNDLTNPNCLIYVAPGETVDASLAQNVVVGETAENIVITDTKLFNAPKAFTANSASYTRSCYIDGGWETIMLPFAPKNVATSGVTDDSYKLEKCSSKDNENVNFIAAEWEANTPYIFRASDNTGAAGVQKEYVFSATNATVAATTEGSYTVNGFKGVYDNLTLAEAGAGYLLKADGESFALCAANSTVLPFRAYIPADGTTPNVLKVTRKDPTSIDSENISNLIYAEGNAIVVRAARAQTIVVNDLAGRTVRTLQVAEGTTTISGLASGFYIVNGQKVLVK